MLKILRRILQEMQTARHVNEALQILVHRVREAVETEACTLFLYDDTNDEYVLVATEGLNPEMVNRIRMTSDKGLVGLVIRKAEPINLEDASAHPQFLYIPEVGEESLRAFLGVPIIHQRRMLGALVVQQKKQRRFDEAEEACLVTLSTQLAPVIAAAEADGLLNCRVAYHSDSLAIDQFDGTSFSGIAAAPGVGVGECFVVYPLADLDAVPDREIESMSLEDELEQFEIAIASVRQDMETLRARLSSTLPTGEQALFDAYLQMLDKMGLGDEVVHEIEQGNWAQGALRTVIKRHEQHFEDMEDDYLKERATDIRDLGRRILAYLQAQQSTQSTYPERTILVGEEVTPTALMEVPHGHLAGVISIKGSSNSHVAILARALRIPAIMGIQNISIARLDGRQVIVDGYYGQVYVEPSNELREEFETLIAQEKQLDADLETLRELPAETRDGRRINLFANIGLLSDAPLSSAVGAEGVGLYRTEIPFLTQDRFPSEEEQRLNYHQLLAAFHPAPVIMRTLDVGGDKGLPYFPIEEENPFLGWRGIRITLDHPEIFLLQLRAMLRASVGFTNLKIMLPMISSASEVDDAIHFIHQAYRELKEEGLEIHFPEIGVMLEVPASIYQIDHLATKVDFFSVGSNDLTQYLLAVDRNNARVVGLYDSLHPAVLRALVQAVKGAHHAQKPISICGEMASDPASVILLLAMGFDALSMNAISLPRMKWVIRQFTLTRAHVLLSEVLMMEHPKQIRTHLELALEEAGLGNLIHIAQ